MPEQIYDVCKNYQGYHLEPDIQIVLSREKAEEICKISKSADLYAREETYLECSVSLFRERKYYTSQSILTSLVRHSPHQDIRNKAREVKSLILDMVMLDSRYCPINPFAWDNDFIHFDPDTDLDIFSKFVCKADDPEWVWNVATPLQEQKYLINGIIEYMKNGLFPITVKYNERTYEIRLFE